MVVDVDVEAATTALIVGCGRQVERGAALAVVISAGRGGADSFETLEEFCLAGEHVGDGVGCVHFSGGGAAVENVVGAGGDGVLPVATFGPGGERHGAGCYFAVFEERGGGRTGVEGLLSGVALCFHGGVARG